MRSGPEPAIKLGIRLHSAGLSLPDTVSVLAYLSVDNRRSTVHNWVQKVGFRPTSEKEPYHDTVDETEIQLNSQRSWLYATVDLETNELLHVRSIRSKPPPYRAVSTETPEKHAVAYSVFLIDGMHRSSNTLPAHSDFSILLMKIERHQAAIQGTETVNEAIRKTFRTCDDRIPPTNLRTHPIS